MPTITRLPEVRSLSQILPSGTEGGKEFARIVDLLLFYAATRQGHSVNLFSDRSGDYHGLDSVLETPIRKERSTGYQYKFFPSPLSSSHRAEIITSLRKAIQSQKSLKLKKWVLVTPDDLTESATKKDGGDVSWFASLKSILGAKFEIEHWGHRKLQALFIETPRLCLYYYPELVNNGASQKQSFLETRKKYDNNMVDANSRIEFIGMSVYKPEATHGVPIEDIYIPVSVLPYLDSGVSLKNARTNPLSLMAPGGRHVILGDPGSGKSTLLKFLLMAGQSERLQGRYNALKDSRLPILVTLRKYGDELKLNKNLPLLDYICQTIQADLSITDADKEFVQYYLEAGQAIILFDGMDELPDASFKQSVRDRIASFLNSYPLVTAIITSRIVGYSPAFGFNRAKFTHHQVAPLLINEIECFVRDWYTARVDNRQAREANIMDLLRILKNPNATAIRTLAENPLLLTIVALVHRIDAVLPDERVVLYQKCTETLLNTWHVWKYKAGEDLSRRGRIERTNRRRIETLALYMHKKSGEAGKMSRAILSEEEVLHVLMNDISRHDDVPDLNEARDIALDFLDFIKQKAGLLIEVGSNEYSFIHLTFQEYLAATALSVSLELDGVKVLWHTLLPHIADPRWHEVIRLLIAGLKSDESQEYIVEQTLQVESLKSDPHLAILLGGLLIDSVKSAEKNAVKITSRLFKYLKTLAVRNSETNVASLLDTLSTKYAPAWDDAFSRTWVEQPQIRREMLLLVIGTGIASDRWDRLTEPKDLQVSATEVQKFSLLLGNNNPILELDKDLKPLLDDYHQNLVSLSQNNRYGNFIGYFGQIAFSQCPAELRYLYWLEIQIADFPSIAGPFCDLYFNATLFSVRNLENPSPLQICQQKAINNYIDDFKNRKIPASQSTSDERIRQKHIEELSGRFRAISAELRHALETFTERKKDRREKLQNDSAWKVFAHFDEAEAIFAESFSDFTVGLSNEISTPNHDFTKSANERWKSLLTNHELIARFSNALASTMSLQPAGLWKQALEVNLMPDARSRLPLFNDIELSKLISNFENNNFSNADILNTVSFYIYDVWLYYYSAYQNPTESPIRKLIALTENIEDSILVSARKIRKLIFPDQEFMNKDTQ